MPDYALGAVEMAIIPLDDGVDDASTVRACLNGEAGSYFVSLWQYDNEITLDFEEIPLLVEAVEFLKLSADATEDEEDEDDEDDRPVAKEWPEPSERFLLDLVPAKILVLLTEPFNKESLIEAFEWKNTPQGFDYWRATRNSDSPLGKEQLDILRSWLLARFALDGE